MARLPSLSYIAGHSRAAFLRFPYVLFCAGLCAALSIILMENESQDFWFIKLFMTFGLGISLFFCLTIYLEKPLGSFRPRPFLLPVAGVLLLAGFYFLSGDAPTENFFMNYAQWALVFHLLAAFSPFLAKGETNGFWQFNRSLFLRFCLSALYAAVFYVGLVLALAAVDHLLGVKVHEKLYFDLWVFSAFVLLTWHFLAGIPADLSKLEGWEDYPAALKIFAQYLLVPLVTLYTLILYLYMGKVLVRWDWPQGTVTWLVSFVSVFGVFTLLLLYPAEKKKENLWIKVFSRGFYAALPPLLVMLFLAVGKRVDQYGITEQRYFVIVLALWILGISAYFLSGRDRSIKMVPMSLFTVALLTSFGPWGAYDVSRNSQMGRLKALFLKNGLWKDGKAVKAAQEVPLEDRRQMSSILDYLVENHGVAPLRGWFTLDLSKWESGAERSRYGYSSVSNEICKSLGFEHVSRWDKDEQGAYFSYYVTQDSRVFPITGYDTLFDVAVNRNFTLKGKTYSWTLGNDKLVFHGLNGEDLVFNLGALLDRVQASPATPNNPALPQEIMTLDSSNGGFKGRLMIKSMDGYKKPGNVKFNDLSGCLLVKKK